MTRPSTTHQYDLVRGIATVAFIAVMVSRPRVIKAAAPIRRR
ncbi:MAG: hypothetical protein N2C14_08855 [Planctomycetales bacterium]